MILQVEIGVIAAALVVLVVVAAPVLTRLRRLAEEGERFLRILNGQVPSLLQEAGDIIRTTNGVMRNLKQGTAGFHDLGIAVGDIGATVDEVHQSIRYGADLVVRIVLANAGGIFAGIRAAMQTLKERPPAPLLGYAQETGGLTRRFRSRA